MSATTDAIRNHHNQILHTMEEYTEKVLGDADPGAANTLATFLAEELLPHAQGEELYLYPALNPILRENAVATATMSLDHQWIEQTVRRISQIEQALQSAMEADRRILREQLSRLALQLLAVVTLHVSKEEQAYLPVMEQHMSEEAQREILERMHSSAETPANERAQAGHGQCECSCGGHE